MEGPRHYNYTVSVDEESRVAHAMDEKGSVIVSLDYSSEAELCSDEFQRCMSDAVALMHLGGVEEGCAYDDVMMEIWREEMQGSVSPASGGREDTCTRVVERWRMEESDRDFALALWAQEREEHMAEKKKKEEKKNRSVWGMMMHGGVHSSAAPLGCAADEFPHLDVNGRNTGVMGTFEPRGNILKSMTRERQSPVYREDEFPMEDWKAVRAATTIEEERMQRDECNRHRLGKNDRDFILSSVADREEMGHGVSPESLKTMMAASATTCEKQEEDEYVEYVDRERYSRKSIRKLVLDMIRAGWNPMPGRGGGHYMYERNVSVPGGSPMTQILVIPSTPSSQKSIDRVYAKLMKCDREVSEKRKEANE